MISTPKIHLKLKLLVSIISLLILQFTCSGIETIKRDSKYTEAYFKANNIQLNKDNSWVLINKPGTCGDWICGARLHNFILSNMPSSKSKIYLIIGNHFDSKLDSIVNGMKNVIAIYDVNSNLARYGFNKIETRVLHFENNKCKLATNLDYKNYIEIGNLIRK